jgi:hypothetical protein
MAAQDGISATCHSFSGHAEFLIPEHVEGNRVIDLCGVRHIHGSR